MIGVYLGRNMAQYETDKQEARSDFIGYCCDKRLNRLEINALRRELLKQGMQDKRIGMEMTESTLVRVST